MVLLLSGQNKGYRGSALNAGSPTALVFEAQTDHANCSWHFPRSSGLWAVGPFGRVLKESKIAAICHSRASGNPWICWIFWMPAKAVMTSKNVFQHPV